MRELDRVLFPESWRKNADYDFKRRVVPEFCKPGCTSGMSGAAAGP